MIGEKMKVGVLADGFRLPIREGIRKAAEMGAAGVQLYAVDGEAAPWNMDAPARRNLRKAAEDSGLVFSAVCGDLGGYGFTNPDENPWRIEKTKEIINLALELGCGIITTHIGVIPSDKNHPRREIMRDTCEKLGSYAQNIGAVLAIETGPEPAAVLRGFLDSLDTRGICVNLDPANLIMTLGDDPVKAVGTLKPYIVHTHAKDGVRMRVVDTTQIYRTFGAESEADGWSGQEREMGEGDCFRELPLGAGKVDWGKYLAALKEIGYTGFLTVERETGEDPAYDIELAINFLKVRLNRLYG